MALSFFGNWIHYEQEPQGQLGFRLPLTYEKPAFHCLDLGDEVLAPMDFLADLYPQSWEYSYLKDEWIVEVSKQSSIVITYAWVHPSEWKGIVSIP